MTELERAKQAKEMLKDIELRLNELDNMVALESIDNLRDYLDSIIAKHTPLTDDERKEVNAIFKNMTNFPITYYNTNAGWITRWENGSYSPYWKVENRIIGIGHTKEEAERDAYNQLKEANKK